MSQTSFSKFVFTHIKVQAKPKFKFQKHSSGIVNNTNTNAKPRAAVFDGIRIIQDLRAVTGMCGSCK